MEWKFDKQKPIYTQIVDVIRLRIITGMYQPGSRLPSVRELAGEASVNPNTMQKALSELERSGLIYTVRTSGRFITEDEEKISSERSRLAEYRVAEFLEQMKSLGIGRNEVVELIHRAEEGEDLPVEKSTDQFDGKEKGNYRLEEKKYDE